MRAKRDSVNKSLPQPIPLSLHSSAFPLRAEVKQIYTAISVGVFDGPQRNETPL
jgi:hypothetical protein